MTRFHFIDHVNNGIVNYSIRYIIVVPITIIIGTISYNIIEVPCQKIGKNIIKKTESKYIAKTK
ncbi:hypothetical protein AGMMS49579_02630 [Spirochaetia bacterium]|nr:hypothetical protein AGMMS49579_02630 [Spirochaetia bacterium]